MHLLLDTYNITHTTGILPPELAGIDVADLARLIRVSRYRVYETVMVCDGEKNPEVDAGRHGRVTVRFAGKGKSADDLIAHLIQKSTTPRRLAVVSSDHEILRNARKRKCQTLTSEEFLQHLVNDIKPRLSMGDSIKPRKKPVVKPTPSSMTTSQVDRWVSVFKVDESDLAAQVDKMVKAMEADDTEPDETSPQAKEQDNNNEKPSKPDTETADKSKPPREKDPSKARHRASTIDIQDTAAAAPAPQPAIPDDLIAQAEQMLNDLDPPSVSTHRKRT